MISGGPSRAARHCKRSEMALVPRLRTPLLRLRARQGDISLLAANASALPPTCAHPRRVLPEGFLKMGSDPFIEIDRQIRLQRTPATRISHTPIQTGFWL